jgi:4-hydroxybenzoate polyprenyltransferase
LLFSLIKVCRPRQYLKNGFVLVGLIFGGTADFGLIARVGLAFVAFCAIASAVYIGNDICDVEADRRHPTKRLRPIASGAVPARVGWTLCGALAAFALLAAAWLGGEAFVCLLSYALINVGYSLWWKHIAVIDVFLIASGFMLRLLMGTIGVDIAPSSWLLLCGMMLTLFLGFAKRRAEMIIFAHRRATDPTTRKVLDDYSPELIEQFTSISAACVILTYGLYTVSPETVARHHTERLIVTLPFVVYGMFRYLYLLHRQKGGHDTARDLMTDPHLIFVGVAWAATTLFVLSKASA